jgi:hypothetical protein
MPSIKVFFEASPSGIRERSELILNSLNNPNLNLFEQIIIMQKLDAKHQSFY